MADEASVRMTVDSSPALTENQKYVRAATETFNVLNKQSIELGLNAKQRVQWMEREIELMKVRNRLGQEETINRLHDDTSLSGKDRSKLIRETRSEGKEDVEELKELNKITKQWTNDQKVSQQKIERMGSGFMRIANGAMMAESTGGMASAVGGGVTGLVAGASIAAIATAAVAALAVAGTIKEIQGASTMEPAVRDYAILRGSSMYGMRDEVSATKDIGLWRYGMTPSQYFTKSAQLTRSGAGVVNEDMMGIIAGEKARGVNLSGVMGVERYGEGKVTNIERYFEKYLRATSQNIAVLPEILQAFTTEAGTILRVTGKVDSSTIAGSVSAVSKGFGLTGEPLQNVYDTMRQGLQQSTNPAIQALQYSVMERSMPKGSSLMQMQMAMENPMANPKYVTGMFDQLKKMSEGNQEDYARSIFNAGLAPSLTIAMGMSGKNLTAENYSKEIDRFKKTPTGGYEEDAKELTGITEKGTARLSGFTERTGFVNVEKMGMLIENMSDSTTTTATIVKVVMHKVDGLMDKFDNYMDKQQLKNDARWLKEEKTEERRAYLMADTMRLNKKIRDYVDGLAQ
jgi:hypothetical protein